MCFLKPHQERNSLKMQQKLIRLSFRPLPFFCTHWVCIFFCKIHILYSDGTWQDLNWRRISHDALKLLLWFCAFFLATPSAYGWQHSRLNLRSFGSYLWHLLMVFDLLKYLSDRTFFSHYNSGGFSVADYWFCQVCRYHSGSSQVSHFWWLLFPL